MGFALSEFEKGPLKRVGDFLVGPWGIAFTVGLLILSTFADGLMRASDEADKNAKANGLVKMSVEDLTKAIDDLTAAQNKAAKSARDAKVDSQAYAAYLYIQAEAARDAARAELEKAIAQAQAANSRAVGGRALNYGANYTAANAQDDVTRLTASLEKVGEAADKARTAYRRAKAELIEYDTTTAAAAKAQDAYTTATRKLREEFAQGKISRDQLTAGIAREKATLESVKDADKNAAAARREHNKELRDAAKAAREADREHEKLLRTIERLTSTYGGGGKKLNTLANDLAEIGRLSLPKVGQDGTVTAGDIPLAQSVDMSVEIDRQRRAEEQRQAQELFKDMFANVPTLREQVEAAERLKQAEKELADIRLNDALQGIASLGSAIDQLFGGSFGGKAANLLGSILQKRSEVGNMTEAEKRYTDGLTKLFGDVGIKIDTGTIQKLGRGIAGAQTGALVNEVTKPLANALGVKTSKTGAQIGGAIGGATGIPGGDIVGSVIGSLVGGAFKKTKYGGVTLTNATGDFSTFGNSAKAQAAAGDFATAIQSGLQSIADQLGGDLGGFNITVGTRHGDYRVNTSGTSLKKKKGAVDFNDDAAAATAYAIQQAVAQGAITGLSEAVQRALKSSPDIDKSLAEALKVQQVEDLLGNMGSELQKTFKALEQQFAERVRIAKQYGFDLVKIEEVNQKDRLAAIEAAVAERVGSLQTLVNDLTFGSLFEGSATAKRDAVQREIEKERAKGAQMDANTLSDLYRQLVENSREAFGTASVQFSTDRQTALSGAAAVIEQQRAAVEAAAQQQRDQLTAAQTQNTLTNETNDLLAQQNALLANIEALFGSWGGGLSLAASSAFDVTGRAVSS